MQNLVAKRLPSFLTYDELCNLSTRFNKKSFSQGSETDISPQYCLEGGHSELFLAQELINFAIQSSQNQPSNLYKLSLILEESERVLADKFPKRLLELRKSEPCQQQAHLVKLEDLVRSDILKSAEQILENLQKEEPYKSIYQITYQGHDSIRGSLSLSLKDFISALDSSAKEMSEAQREFAIAGQLAVSILTICDKEDKEYNYSTYLRSVIKDLEKIDLRYSREPKNINIEQSSFYKLCHSMIDLLHAEISRTNRKTYDINFLNVLLASDLNQQVVSNDNRESFIEDVNFAGAFVIRGTYERQSLVSTIRVLKGMASELYPRSDRKIRYYPSISESTISTALLLHQKMYDLAAKEINYFRLSRDQNISDLLRPLISCNADSIYICADNFFENNSTLAQQHSHKHLDALKVVYLNVKSLYLQAERFVISALAWFKEAITIELEALKASNITFVKDQNCSYKYHIYFDWAHPSTPNLLQRRSIIYFDLMQKALEAGSDVDNRDLIDELLRGRDREPGSAIIVEVEESELQIDSKGMNENELRLANIRLAKLQELIACCDGCFNLPNYQSSQYGTLKLNYNLIQERKARQAEIDNARDSQIKAAKHERDLATLASTNSNQAEKISLAPKVADRFLKEKDLNQAFKALSYVLPNSLPQRGDEDFRAWQDISHKFLKSPLLFNSEQALVSNSKIFHALVNYACADKKVDYNLRSTLTKLIQHLRINSKYELALLLLLEPDHLELSLGTIQSKKVRSILNDKDGKLAHLAHELAAQHEKQKAAQEQQSADAALNIDFHNRKNNLEQLALFIKEHSKDGNFTVPSALTLEPADFVLIDQAQQHLNNAALAESIDKFRRIKEEQINKSDLENVFDLAIKNKSLQALEAWSYLVISYISISPPLERSTKLLELLAKDQQDLSWLFTCINKEETGKIGKIPDLINNTLKGIDHDKASLRLYRSACKISLDRLLKNEVSNQKKIFELLARSPNQLSSKIDPALSDLPNASSAFSRIRQALSREHDLAQEIREKQKREAQITSALETVNHFQENGFPENESMIGSFISDLNQQLTFLAALEENQRPTLSNERIIQIKKMISFAAIRAS